MFPCLLKHPETQAALYLESTYTLLIFVDGMAMVEGNLQVKIMTCENFKDHSTSISHDPIS